MRSDVRIAAASLLALAACAHPPPSEPASRPAALLAPLEAVAAVHGGAGPWAVAGYRMGQFALGRLGVERGSLDLEVVHFTPRQVQYACIADGAAAATGASAGKLNLTLEDAPADDTRTRYSRRSTGAAVVLRLTPAFRARFLDVPREQLAEAGREVLALEDAAIFEVVP